MANKPMHGSICMTDLSEAFKKNHSAFNKSEKNGKLYANIAVWMNDQPDQYGNILSFQLNSKKDAEDDKVYFGNAKLPDAARPVQAATASSTQEEPDLPF
jgi:hypothetical protein